MAVAVNTTTTADILVRLLRAGIIGKIERIVTVDNEPQLDADGELQLERKTYRLVEVEEE
ncbi:MAG: hypothetical protein H6637_05445 [Ardenticatenales bacterium]|nr:hypothetical protein [Ardenticatenales bacterium]